MAEGSGFHPCALGNTRFYLFMTKESGGKKQDFLSLPEVQVFLGIKSRKTILKYIKSGKLPAYKIGGTRWRFAYSDVHLFLKQQFIAIADEPVSNPAPKPGQNPERTRV